MSEAKTYTSLAVPSPAMKRLLVLLPFVACGTIAAPVPIFDGRTLDGWEGNPQLWHVEDGMLTGGSLTEKVAHNDFLATVKSYANFDLRLKLKLSGTDGFINSGVQIRSLRVPGSPEMSGYQVDYGKGWYGKLYDESRRNKVIAESTDQKAATAAIKEGDWNEYRIRTDGAHIQSWINGVPALDYTEADPQIAQDGHIGIQIHGGGKAQVQVKEITIEELPPTPNAPIWEKVGKPGAKKSAAAGTMKEGNVTTSVAKTPAEERATFQLPEGFEAELVAAEDPANGIGKFVPIAFDQRGAIWTTTALEYPVDGNENPQAADALYASKAKDKVLVYDRDPASPTGYASKPRIFADGLAIPLGVLPYGKGCYVQHGHDIVLLEDTDADGRADKRTVVLGGFGVQDSHLFPHQFMRAPGGWIWLAQGLFNKGTVKTKEGKEIPFDMCRMAKFRPDGSGFEATSVGPNNIWGLVLNGVGEAFIQEANDYGYPVMPFEEYAYYPGGAERLSKSYQPPFPQTADFRMGGTGLSGLALTDAAGPFPEPWRDMMLVANPITNRIQAIKMHRDGPRWKLDQPKDFLVSSDPWFRPVAISIGPDGCLYIVDWYNKIISHNEVPRNHPDRDKTRGRIWRVKPSGAKLFAVSDFTKLSEDELITKLGSESLTQSHLAWQTLSKHERSDEFTARFEKIFLDPSASSARRIQALWVLTSQGYGYKGVETLITLARDKNAEVRREAVAAVNCGLMWSVYEAAAELAFLANDPDPGVRAEYIRQLGRHFSEESGAKKLALRTLLSMAREPLSAPIAPSSRNGKPIKVREAYERDYERFLIRMYLERNSAEVASFLDSDSSKGLPSESLLLASLALEPRISAGRVAELLPQLQRPPGQEEVLRLAQFPEEPGVGEALRATLNNPTTRNGVLEALLATRTQLDQAKLTPLLNAAAAPLLAGNDPAGQTLGIQLAAGFQLAAQEPALTTLAGKASPQQLAALRALAQIGSGQSELFASLATGSNDAPLREAAALALASSKASDAGARLLKLWPELSTGLRRGALDRLAGTTSGAKTIVEAIRGGTIKKEELDGPAVEKLQAVLGPNDAGLASLLGELDSLFRPVLALNGHDDAWTDPGLNLDGPFTVESWVRLDPSVAGRQKITNDDGIFGAPGQLDMNFYDAKFRVWVGGGLADVAASKKPVTPGLWTHVAAVRNEEGTFRLYQDGELVGEGTKKAPMAFTKVRIGWAQPKGGTAGMLSEFRVWNRARSADEIRRDFDRTFEPNQPPAALVFTGWGKAQPGAKVIRTSDFPPVMSVAEAKALDEKFAKYRALAEQPGDATRGKTAAMVCQACHLFKGQGATIGPDLSGVGSMGTEAILRNILTPNAAMENGYRIYRVELKSGDLVDAFYVSEDATAVVVRQPGVPDRRITKADIREAKYLRRSLMPEGLLDGFNAEQVRDLFAFLQSMR